MPEPGLLAPLSEAQPVGEERTLFVCVCVCLCVCVATRADVYVRMQHQHDTLHHRTWALAGRPLLRSLSPRCAGERKQETGREDRARRGTLHSGGGGPVHTLASGTTQLWRVIRA